MNTIILRRRRLGRTSCREIARLSQRGIRVVRNDSEVPEDTDLVIRWGTTSNVPCSNVLNKSSAIHWASDKRGSRLAMQDAGISVPRTWGDRDAYYDHESEGSSKLVFRPQRHAQGRHLYVVSRTDIEEIEHLSHRIGDYYISELINKVAEYRVFVVSGRVATCARKYPADESSVAWNVAQGGRFENVRWDDWPLRVVKEAIRAHELSGLDFSGVDVMVDSEGTPFVLEINSAPSLTSPYRQECMAKCFDWVIDNGKEPIPLVEERGGYLKFIHPAITERARL